MFKKFFATSFVSLFIASSFLFMVLFGFYNTVFDKDLYGDEFIDIIYDYSISTLIDNFDLSAFTMLDDFPVEDVLREVVTKEDVGGVVADTINSLSVIEINEETGIVDISIPFGWLVDKKDAIAEKIAFYMYEKLDVCELKDLENFSENFACLPPGLSVMDLQLQVNRVLDRNIFSVLPDDLVFSVLVPSGDTGSFADFVNQKYIYVSGLLLLLMTVSILLIALFIFKPLSLIFRWVFFTIFVTTLFGIGFYLILFNSSDILYENLVNISDAQVDVYITLYDYFVKIMSRNMLYVLVPTSLISFVLAIFTFINIKK